jgi:hypothetical protein
VHGLEDGRVVVTNISRWGKTQSTDETGAQVAHDVTIQIWKDHDVEFGGVEDELHASVVDHQFVVLDGWELCGYFTASLDEETIGHLPVMEQRRISKRRGRRGEEKSRGERREDEGNRTEGRTKE